MDNNIFNVEIYKTKVIAHLNTTIDALNYYLNKCKDVSHVSHFECGDHDLSLIDNSDISYLIELVKQALELNK